MGIGIRESGRRGHPDVDRVLARLPAPSSSDLLSLVVEGTAVGRLTLGERSSPGGAVEEPISDRVRGGGAKDGGTPRRGGDGEGGNRGSGAATRASASRAAEMERETRTRGVQGRGRGSLEVVSRARRQKWWRRSATILGGRGAVRKFWRSRAGGRGRETGAVYTPLLIVSRDF